MVSPRRSRTTCTSATPSTPRPRSRWRRRFDLDSDLPGDVGFDRIIECAAVVLNGGGALPAQARLGDDGLSLGGHLLGKGLADLFLPAMRLHGRGSGEEPPTWRFSACIYFFKLNLPKDSGRQ